MKKLLLAASFALLTASSFASQTPVSEKVLVAFSAAFPGVDRVKWSDNKSSYEAYFEKDGIRCRVRFDLDGKVKSTIRYYTSDKLNPFLQAKVSQKYPGKTIFGITEVSSDEEQSYNIILEDDKTWTHVRCDASGSMEVTNKFRKAEK